jgi:hypothetical protein
MSDARNHPCTNCGSTDLLRRLRGWLETPFTYATPNDHAEATGVGLFIRDDPLVMEVACANCGVLLGSAAQVSAKLAGVGGRGRPCGSAD